MTANPTAAAIARDTGRGYHEVRIGINRLVAEGWVEIEAATFIRGVTGGSIEKAVSGAIAARRLGHSPAAGPEVRFPGPTTYTEACTCGGWETGFHRSDCGVFASGPTSERKEDA